MMPLAFWPSVLPDCDRGAQHVAGRELDHADVALQALRLGALSRPPAVPEE
jgi:hypothetical protein